MLLSAFWTTDIAWHDSTFVILLVSYENDRHMFVSSVFGPVHYVPKLFFASTRVTLRCGELITPNLITDPSNTLDKITAHTSRLGKTVWANGSDIPWISSIHKTRRHTYPSSIHIFPHRKGKICLRHVERSQVTESKTFSRGNLILPINWLQQLNRM